ncbi:hypothetical protein OGZ02_13560 [Brachyspira hyodysenteriae]|nr:hypothetical protein [Brachyspira hyodysenteriae]MDA1469828.1 hypothetical protein [Brachyspira hyodysenteriae]
MTVNKINNAQSLQQIQANPQKSDAAPQNAVNTQKLKSADERNITSIKQIYSML